MEPIARMLIRAGYGGFALTLLLNLYFHFVLQKPFAEFFSSFWWVGWVPTYLFWSITWFMGYRGMARVRGSDDGM
ncbi:MAG: hypothetical protein Cons2KO_18090 [Congregibacter sp.]